MLIKNIAIPSLTLIPCMKLLFQV